MVDDTSKHRINYDNFLSSWCREIPESEIRRLLAFQGKYYFAGGKPGSLPIEILTKIIRNLANQHESDWKSGDPAKQLEVLEDYNYGETGGKKYLQEVLAQRMKAKDNVDVDPSQVTITSGSQQAIYGILDSVINPGDMIVTTRPAYLGFLGPAVKLGATVVTTPSDLDGMMPDVVEDCFKQCIRDYSRVPKIIYVVGYSDNPKATTLPEKRKRELFNIAEQYNCLIIDDEAYKYIQFDSPDHKVSPIKAYDKDNNRVAYMCTTSKEAAVFRLGYNVLPEPLQREVLKDKGYLDLCTTTFLQRVAATYYKEYIDEALKPTLAEYKIRCKAMIEGIEKNFPEGEFTRPTGGFFVWWESKNPNFVSSKFMEQYLIKEEIIYVPGESFYPIKGLAYKRGKIGPNFIKKRGMRLGFSFKDVPTITEGMEKLGKILSDHL